MRPIWFNLIPETRRANGAFQIRTSFPVSVKTDDVISALISIEDV
jgi:hypothetical protein